MPARVPARHAASPARHETGPRLGRWIRETRMAQGFSQRALAERSGLSRSYLCDIERGRGAQPSMNTIDKLAAALGATRADLMRAAGLIDTPALPRESEPERRLLALFRDLGESSQHAVMRFARFTHADEHRWVQSPLPGERADVVVDHHHGYNAGAGATGPTLFELDTVAAIEPVGTGDPATSGGMQPPNGTLSR